MSGRGWVLGPGSTVSGTNVRPWLGFGGPGLGVGANVRPWLGFRVLAHGFRHELPAVAGFRGLGPASPARTPGRGWLPHLALGFRRPTTRRRYAPPRARPRTSKPVRA